MDHDVRNDNIALRRGADKIPRMKLNIEDEKRIRGALKSMLQGNHPHIVPYPGDRGESAATAVAVRLVVGNNAAPLVGGALEHGAAASGGRQGCAPLSVGIGFAGDILADLEQALNKV